MYTSVSHPRRNQRVLFQLLVQRRQKLVLILINGGGVGTWLFNCFAPADAARLRKKRDTPPIVKRLLREIKAMRILVIQQIPEYATCKEDDNNRFALCIQEFESMCLLAIDRYFEQVKKSRWTRWCTTA